jgi:hypothetical protein
MTASNFADLVPSLSLDALVLKRDALVERLTAAHAALEEAQQLADNLFGPDHRGPRLGLLNHVSRREFTGPSGLDEMVREVDGRTWAYLLRESGLRSFMDATSRAQWDKAIEANDVPPLTMATIETTFAALYDTRRDMLERGVVDVFRRLSWDYKTNNPVMFGERLILRHIVEAYGYPSQTGTDQLDDLARVLSVLDGRPEPDSRRGTYRLMSEARFPSQTRDIEIAGLFTVRGFKNGNGHLRFLRMDLVDRMNAILAKHFPSALPAARGDAG